MVSTFGAISREAREVVITLLSPFPFLVICLYLMEFFSGGVVFFLVLGISIPFFYIFVKETTNQLSNGLKETKENLLAPEYGDKSAIESIWQAREDFKRMQKDTDYEHITATEGSLVIPKVVWAIQSLFRTVVVWYALIFLFAALISIDIYDTLILELRRIFTVPEVSLLTLLPSAAALIAKLGDNLLKDIGLGNAILIVLITLIPSFVFQVAAVNLVAASEEAHRRFVIWCYNEDGRLRKYEAPGYLLLLAIYIVISHLISS